MLLFAASVGTTACHESRDGDGVLRVSVSSDGATANSTTGNPVVSADGRFVAFDSLADNLDGTTGVAGSRQVYVHEIATARTSRVSISSSGEPGNADSAFPSLSADGRFVAFGSLATNLVADDRNGALDVFLHDRSTGRTERVSVTPGGSSPNGESGFPSISADGGAVAFVSLADDVVAGDRNFLPDVFVRDRHRGRTLRVSVARDGGDADRGSGSAVISGDGGAVAFVSFATNLVAGEPPIGEQVYVRDLRRGVTEAVSRSSAGAWGDAASGFPSISHDGSRVAFESFASNLVADDRNGTFDVFLRRRDVGRTVRLSVTPSGGEVSHVSRGPAISPDGRWIAFHTMADDVVAPDANADFDVVLRAVGDPSLVRVSSARDGRAGDHGSLDASVADGGRAVAFLSFATDLVPDGASGRDRQVYVRRFAAAPSTAFAAASREPARRR